MDKRDRVVVVLFAVATASSSALQLLAARLVASGVLEVVPAPSDLYGNRPLLLAFPNLWHIVAAGLVPVILGAVAIYKKWERGRVVECAVLYSLGIASVVGLVYIAAARLYLGAVAQ